MRIRITVGNVSMEADMFDTPTSRKIIDVLPFEACFNTWGDEIYFEVPVKADLDDTARDVVEVGDLGYWPTGRAFCIFFGQTPMSEPGIIRPASAVNIVGKIIGDATRFKEVANQETVRMEVVE